MRKDLPICCWKQLTLVCFCPLLSQATDSHHFDFIDMIKFNDAIRLNSLFHPLVNGDILNRLLRCILEDGIINKCSRGSFVWVYF